MDRTTFEAVDPLVDEIAELVDDLLSSEQAAPLKRKLAELSGLVGEGRSVSLDCRLEVFDSVRERALPVLSTGLSTTDGKEPYRTSGDSSPQRYVAIGGMMIVPHDHCPLCWRDWDFKFVNPVCSACGAALGDEVKILLDSDVCPYCEEGRVTMQEPTCTKCGFVVRQEHVVWG